MRRFVPFAMLLALAAAAAAQDQKEVDQAFEQLETYDFDQPRKPLSTLELAIARSTADPQLKAQIAARLAAVLADPKATRAAKLFACQQLPLVGGEAQVPALVKLLDGEETVEGDWPPVADRMPAAGIRPSGSLRAAARRALEAIPGEASLAALRAALARLKGRALVGVVNSLGVRRDAQAVGDLARLLEGPDAAVAAAAAEALGRMGTPEAAAALSKAPASLGTALHNARLLCAEGLAAGGNAAAAEAIYAAIWKSDSPSWLRLAGLSGLVKVARGTALPLVIGALGSDDPLVQATALRLATALPGQDATAALVGQLDRLDPQGQVLLIGVLADRGEKSAAPAVEKLIDADDQAVRAAAIAAMAALGDASCVDRLMKLAATGSGSIQRAAREALARLPGPDVDRRLLAVAAKGEPAPRIEAIRAVAARRSPGAAPVLLEAAAEADAGVRQAAFEALAVAGQAGDYPRLVELLVAAPSPAAEKAALAVRELVASPADATSPVLAALKTAPAQAKPSLVRVLGSMGGPEALAAVRACLGEADPALRDAAVRALAGWPDASAADDLLKLAKGSEDATHRVLALRGYFGLVRGARAEDRLKMLEQVRPIATTAEAKKLLLAGLAAVADPGALEVAQSFAEDPEVKAEAEAAVRRIQEALKPKPAAGSADVPPHDPKRSAAIKQEVAKRAPRGYHLACYLDCGPDTADGAKGGPTLRLLDGQAYKWAGSPDRFGTIFYTSSQVAFEAVGLSTTRTYQLGFSWWDFDSETRAESLWLATGKGQQSTKVLDATKLPSGTKGEKPAEKTLAVPRELSADGALRITFRNEGQPNVVVSEVWLWESDAESAAPEKKAEPPRKPPEARVLVLTGLEYPGHPWKLTAPALAEMVEEDPRMAVDVVERPEFLADPKLQDYDAIVLNYMNWEKPDPGPAARAGLQKFVEGGKGLVLFHFACGAFQGWPEFARIAGRAWDPKLRGHDPRGRFRVEITDVKHPITEGMKPFETDDELYTCLAGDAPIQVLATATSKVDKKDYPMAFVLSYGKGRVFHCVLGHDLKALAPPEAGELYRRGTAWAAGLTPVAK